MELFLLLAISASITFIIATKEPQALPMSKCHVYNYKHPLTDELMEPA